MINFRAEFLQAECSGAISNKLVCHVETQTVPNDFSTNLSKENTTKENASHNSEQLLLQQENKVTECDVELMKSEIANS